MDMIVVLVSHKSFAQQATTTFFSHFVGDACSRTSAAHFFNLSDTNSPVRLRWAGSVCRPGQHGKPWRSQVAGAFQLPQLRDAAFPAFPQFCLKIFTFAGIIVQSESM